MNISFRAAFPENLRENDRLFTLAGFDVSERNGVIAPFSSGAAAIVQNPYLEKDSSEPREIIGNHGKWCRRE